MGFLDLFGERGGEEYERSMLPPSPLEDFYVWCSGIGGRSRTLRVCAVHEADWVYEEHGFRDYWGLLEQSMRGVTRAF